MIEKWCQIQGYEGLYEVSNYGRVKSVWGNGRSRGRKVDGRLLRCNPSSSKGYPRVWLIKSGVKRLEIDVHRLVALHFIPNPDNKPFVNHLDGIKSNNNIDNLEWVTPSENSKHAYSIGLMKAPHGEESANSKITETEVHFIRKSRGKISCDKLARMLGVGHTTIWNIQVGKRWSHIRG